MNRIGSVLLLGLLLAACGPREVESVEEFNELTARVDTYTAQLVRLKGEVTDLVQAFNQTVSKEKEFQLHFDGKQHTDEHIHLLEQRIEGEEDESCCNLLSQALDACKQLATVEASYEDALARLPKARMVKRGDNHYTLCLHYLEHECKLQSGTAKLLLADAHLQGDIIEGFEVFFMYKDGKFGTYISQGSTDIAPCTMSGFAKATPAKKLNQPSLAEDGDSVLDSLKQAGALLSTISSIGK